MDELYTLTEIAAWSSLMAKAERVQPLPEFIAVVREHFFLTLQHYLDFKRSVCDVLDRDPFRLLLICKRGRHVVCELRREVCNDILNTPEDKLHSTTLKLKRILSRQLHFAADHGLCAPELWVQVELWAERLVSDTQQIEGFNTIVCSAVNMAPNIKLPLLSARCTSTSFLFDQDTV